MKTKYDVYEIPNSAERKDKKLYYVRLVPIGTVNTQMLAERIEYGTSLTRTDVTSVLSSLSYQIERALKNGERVHLEGLGYFQMKITSTAVESPEKMRAENVRFKSIAFLPEKSLKRKFAATKFMRTKRKSHSKNQTNEIIEEKLKAYFQETPFITRAEFEKLCGLTKGTALNKLNALLKEGKLKRKGIYRFPVYMPDKK
ncbi:MAG: HU family DNA-binding protein [Candidatus Azobacteroides sp.]|nr:HU family DNA-binding protein [Candidatus Azobacteroides sp.]